MSDLSANLALPYILPSQAQKHVTHNEALLILDALVQLTVASADQTDPPGVPAAGDRYILPTGATGAWSGHDTEVAAWVDSDWLFLPPAPGWIAWVADQEVQMRFDGTGWTALLADVQAVDKLGVNATADVTNRLAVASDASLLSHDGAGHQVKINKAGTGDTASLLMQSNWSGRAELGLVGSDDLVFKVSDDGTTFRTALTAAAATGVVDFPQGATGLTPADLGAPDLATLDYVAARGGGLVANGAGHLPSGWNFPATATRDTVETPDLPAAFTFAGHYPGPVTMAEAIPVDPHAVYDLRAYLRQEGVAGDWSAYAEGDRHQQGIGLACYDADGFEIEAKHHMRYRAGGTDSLTTLATPLAPGDTVIQLTDSAGWNDSDADSEACGIIIFGYRTAGGRVQQHYSRIVDHGLFAPAGVNKTAHTVTLSAGLPAAFGNPDDGGGVWPAGTVVANTAVTTGPKLCAMAGTVPPLADSWYQARGRIGGIDRSGTNVAQNFAPGTAFVRPLFLPNWSNRSGGFSGFPDTGANQKVGLAGITFFRDVTATYETVTSGTAPGSQMIYAAAPNVATGQIDVIAAVSSLTEV